MTFFGRYSTARSAAAPRIPAVVDEAFRDAHAILGAEFGTIDGLCLEASVLMHKALREAGLRPTLVRREMKEGLHYAGGHWTVLLGGVEYDPTIGYAPWGIPYKQVPRQQLYVVGPTSPHHNWPRTRVDTKRAYAVAGELVD